MSWFADKGTERDRLFEGTTSDSKPRLRTAEEIKAKYRKEVILIRTLVNVLLL